MNMLEIERFNNTQSNAQKEQLASSFAVALESYDGADKQGEIKHILHVLLNDISTNVRRALAANLRNSQAVSQEVIKQLLDDIDEVTIPFIENTKLLDQQQLCDIVKSTTSVQRQQAVAGRDDVSENLSQTLVEYALDETVVMTLLNNCNAAISSDTMDDIAEKYTVNEDVLSALVKRDDIQLELIHKVTDNISSKLADKLNTNIQQKHGISSDQIQQAVQQAKYLTLFDNLTNCQDISAARLLVDKLKKENQLDYNVVMAALCIGQLHFIMFAISRLSGAVSTHVPSWIEEETMPEQFTAALQKAELPATFDQDFFYALRFMKELEKEQSKYNPKTFIPLFFSHIEENKELFPNATFLQMLLRAHPYFSVQG
jgi:uncharacterized protein (DUF2336 family)